MKLSKQQLILEKQYSQYGGGLPTWTYIAMIISGIIIVYLLVLRSRIDEFFEGDISQPVKNSSTDKPSNSPSNSLTDKPSNSPSNSLTDKPLNEDNSIYVKEEINPYEVRLVWQGQLTGSNRYLSIWQRKNKQTQNLTSFGQYATVTNNKIDGLSMEEIKENGVLNMLVKGGKFPIKYIKIWSSDTITNGKKPETDMSIWQPIPPNGYSALGDIVVPSLSKPSRDSVICIPNKYLSKNGQFKKQVYQNSFSPDNTISIWKVGNYGAFIANQANNKPIMRADDIKDLTQNLLNKKEYDISEKHSGIQVILSTNPNYIVGRNEE